MTHSGEINELAAALAKAQKAFTVPKKGHTAKAGSYSYKYSTLDDLIEATRGALADQGIAVVQNMHTPDGGTVAVATMLLHASGQWIQFDPFVLPSGATPQTAGAAGTYARRYSMGAALAVAAEEDDDAQSVQPPAKPARKADPPPAALPGPAFEEPSHPPAQRMRDSGQGHELLISQAQRGRLYALMKQAGYSDAEMKAWLKEVWGYDRSEQIPRAKYREICDSIQDRKAMA